MSKVSTIDVLAYIVNSAVVILWMLASTLSTGSGFWPLIWNIPCALYICYFMFKGVFG